MSYRQRVEELTLRAAAGARWMAALQAAAPRDLVDASGALARWVGIESDGNPATVSSEGERGLTQVPKSAVTEGWFSVAEFDALISPQTTDSMRAKLAWKHVAYLDSRHPAGWDQKARVWRAYMRHALPALYSDLVARGYLGDPPNYLGGPLPGEQIDEAWQRYTPLPNVARFAPTGGEGTVGQRTLVRFVAAADVVAGYYRGASWANYS